MGQEASKPDPRVKLRVIGAGLSRTGTTSFAQACEILLGGPVYHGGTALVTLGESHMQSWINAARHTPVKSPRDQDVVDAELQRVLSGYSCVTDMPPILFTAELVRLWPDAIVIVTTRRKEDWWASMEPIMRNVDRDNRFLAWLWCFLPTLRFWQDWVDAMRAGRFQELYYAQRGITALFVDSYDDHIAYVKRVTPAERLHFFDVRDGWGPLCKILDVPVPEGVEFPRTNDAAFVEDFFKKQVVKGFVSWFGAVGAVAAAGVGVWWQWGR